LESGPLEVVERLHLREPGLLEPQSRGVLVPRVQLALKQFFQELFVLPAPIPPLPGEAGIRPPAGILRTLTYS
jgi:hypothetical protein